MKPYRFIYLIIIPLISFSDQPIMNMMPRWTGGHGYQILYESIHRDNLLRSDDIIRKGWNEDINLLHIQGVYTWHRSIRITAKLPVILNAERENLINNQKVVQRDKGIGDLTLALPLKKYFNLLKRAGSWTLAPQIRIPLASKDDYDISDRKWGGNIFIGYETETRNYFFSTGASFWYMESDEPNEFHSSLDAGLNVKDNMQVLLETDFHNEEDGKQYLSLGPAIYYRKSDIIHMRFEFKKEMNARAPDEKLDHVGGYRLNLGIGFVY